MTRQYTRSTLTRAFAAAAIALTALAGTAASATAAPSAPTPSHDVVPVSIQPQDGAGGRQWQYWDWYWFLASCISAGNSGERHDIWSDYVCLPNGVPGQPTTTYDLIVYR